MILLHLHFLDVVLKSMSAPIDLYKPIVYIMFPVNLL